LVDHWVGCCVDAVAAIGKSVNNHRDLWSSMIGGANPRLGEERSKDLIAFRHGFQLQMRKLQFHGAPGADY
jgi:hypothetical protein